MDRNQLNTLVAYAANHARIVQILGFSRAQILVSYELLRTEGPWKVQPLAEWLGFSRTAVQRVLDMYLASGSVERLPEGYQITLLGRHRFQTIFRESIEIACGVRKGFSADTTNEIVMLKERFHGDPIDPRTLLELNCSVPR